MIPKIKTLQIEWTQWKLFINRVTESVTLQIVDFGHNIYQEFRHSKHRKIPLRDTVKIL